MVKMKRLEFAPLGVTLAWPEGDKSAASIESTGNDELGNKEFESAVHALESVVLAHFCAGVDIEAPAYVQGVETAYQAAANHLY